MTSTTSATSGSSSITQALGVGSGIDLKALVASLVDAQYAAKTSQFTARQDTLTAQISGLAKLKSGITGFDSALRSLVKGGSLATQPTSSNSGVAAVSRLAGAKVAGISAKIDVTQLAAAQAATTNMPVGATEGFRAGTLSVVTGSYVTDAEGKTSLSATRTVSVDIAAGATLSDIAAQIKDKTGLSASVISDGNGQRLTIKGATGASQAFEITGSDTGAGGLSLATLSVGPDATGTTVGTKAQDAVVMLDGARFTRSSNTINNLFDGVRLDLQSVGTVTIGTDSPSNSLMQAAQDFVDTFNQVKAVIAEETNVTDGVLKTDSAATAMMRALGALTTTRLATAGSGGPQALADIGVSTNRDGTLSFNTATFNKAIAADPAAVEALFADGTGASGGGLSAALSAVVGKLTDKNAGLDGSTARYTKQQSDLADAKSKAGDAATMLSTRLTSQFAAMDARVAAYKATQAFMTQQIAQWTKGND
jgi:flagellar hook-associated protein 2